MFTVNLPRENSTVETTNSHNQKSYYPGRNLPDLPFRQFSNDGSVKKEFLPVKSSGADESVSDESKLANWGNLQNKLTAKNLDEVALDLLKLRSAMSEEKDQISAAESKLGLIDHLLSDTTEIKDVVSKAADRIERRLQKIEELLAASEKLEKKAPGYIYSRQQIQIGTQSNVENPSDDYNHDLNV